MSISRFPRLARMWGAVAASLLASAVLLACGGGSGSGDGASAAGGTTATSTSDPAKTGSFSSGRITGFGSIIVNGIRFDDSAASFSDDDDASRSRSDLRLGMVVEILSGAITPGTDTTLGSATATAVRVVDEIKGPVEAKGTGTITVLGQVVTVTSGTVFEAGTSLASIAVGDILEVFGIMNASGQITATRIEVEDRGTGTSHFKLRGVVANLDAAARAFSIGGANISFASLAPQPTLANGNFVRVRLDPVRNGALWTATRIDPRRPFENQDEAKVEGFVTAYAGSGTRFEVNGLPVDASAARFKDGSVANLAVGVRVEVEGAVRNGVLAAREVEFEGIEDEREVEVKDVIDAVQSPSTFVVRGVRFVHDATTRFKDGTAARLAAGVRVEVKGTLSADGVSVHADEIDFES